MDQNNEKIYNLTISGQEITVSKDISEDLAHKILVLLVPSSSTKLVDSVGTSGETEIIGEISPKDFVLQKKPATDIERMACLGFYLANYRNTPEFKTEDLTNLNKEAQQIRFSNPSAAARNAVQFGYLERAGGGRKQMTTRGESVVKALPDRENVKSALEDGPKPRRTKKTTVDSVGQ